MLILGNGVGGAALVSGRFLRGHSGVADNIGHLTVNPYGAICFCGNQGCMETVFSAALLAIIAAPAPTSTDACFEPRSGLPSTHG